MLLATKLNYKFSCNCSINHSYWLRFKNYFRSFMNQYIESFQSYYKVLRKLLVKGMFYTNSSILSFKYSYYYFFVDKITHAYLSLIYGWKSAWHSYAHHVQKFPHTRKRNLNDNMFNHPVQSNLDNVTLVHWTPWYYHLKLSNKFFQCKSPLIFSLIISFFILFFQNPSRKCYNIKYWWIECGGWMEWW